MKRMIRYWDDYETGIRSGPRPGQKRPIPGWKPGDTKPSK